MLEKRSRRNENDFVWEHPNQSSFDIAHVSARNVVGSNLCARDVELTILLYSSKLSGRALLLLLV